MTAGALHIMLSSELLEVRELERRQHARCLLGAGANIFGINVIALAPGFTTGTLTSYAFSPTTAGVPEPAAWALMLLGFGTAGTALRRRRAAPVHLK